MVEGLCTDSLLSLVMHFSSERAQGAACEMAPYLFAQNDSTSFDPTRETGH